MTRIPTVEIEVDGRRKIVNADDPRAQEHAVEPEPELTKEGIEKMPRKGVVAALEAHGATEIPEDAKLDDLRKQLIAVAFVDL